MATKQHTFTFSTVSTTGNKTLAYLRRELKPGIEKVTKAENFVPDKFTVVYYEGERQIGDIPLVENAKLTIVYNA